VFVEFDTELIRPDSVLRRRINPTESTTISNFFLFYPLVGRGITDGNVLVSGLLYDCRVVRKNRIPAAFPSAGRTLEILAVGTDIVVEICTLGFGVVVFGQNDLFLGISATDAEQ